MKGREIKLYYHDALVSSYLCDTIPKIDNAFETLQNLVNVYEEPNNVKIIIGADKKVTIHYSTEIDIELPYVFRDYPITYVKESERFTYTILYKHTKIRERHAKTNKLPKLNSRRVLKRARTVKPKSKRK